VQAAIRRMFVLFAALLFAVALWAQGEGESLYKSKCANCHGPTGEGKVGPALKTAKVTEDDLILLLGKGNDAKKAPHKKPMSTLSDDQIKAVAHYVKSLK
jgi:mono/diheme cytochrome c family protein